MQILYLISINTCILSILFSLQYLIQRWWCSFAQLCPTLRPHVLQHTRLPCPSPSCGCPPVPDVKTHVHCQWCYQLILCCPLLLPSIFARLFLVFSVFSSESARFSSFFCFFLVSQLVASGSQSIWASASVLPVNIRDWFPLELIGLISLQSKGLSRIVFSNTTVQKHQFLDAQPLWPNCHIHTWLLENYSFDYMGLCQRSNPLLFNMLSRFVIAFLPTSIF